MPADGQHAHLPLTSGNLEAMTQISPTIADKSKYIASFVQSQQRLHLWYEKEGRAYASAWNQRESSAELEREEIVGKTAASSGSVVASTLLVPRTAAPLARPAPQQAPTQTADPSTRRARNRNVAKGDSSEGGSASVGSSKPKVEKKEIMVKAIGATSGGQPVQKDKPRRDEAQIVSKRETQNEGQKSEGRKRQRSDDPGHVEREYVETSTDEIIQ